MTTLMMRVVSFIALALCTAGLTACGAHGQNAMPTNGMAQRSQVGRAAAASPIQHVVIIVQENRSFDNLFNGFPGADTVRIGFKHDGSAVALQPVPLLRPIDIRHTHSEFVTAYDGGKNDGFDRELIGIRNGLLRRRRPIPILTLGSRTSRPIGRLRNATAWPTGCSSLTPVPAFQRTNTSSPVNRSRRIRQAKSLTAATPQPARGYPCWGRKTARALFRASII